MKLALPRFAKLSVVTTQLVGISTRQLQRDIASGKLHRFGKPGGVTLVDVQEVKELYGLNGPSSTIDDIVNEILHDIRSTRRVAHHSLSHEDDEVAR